MVHATRIAYIVKKEIHTEPTTDPFCSYSFLGCNTTVQKNQNFYAFEMVEAVNMFG